jgi:hypothetical protein
MTPQRTARELLRRMGAAGNLMAFTEFTFERGFLIDSAQLALQGLVPLLSAIQFFLQIQNIKRDGA